jgi:hypothetical protein
MNTQEIRDRLKLSFTILSDSHFQAVSGALKTDDLLAEDLVNLSKNSLRVLERDLDEHARRVTNAASEVASMIREVY